MAHRRELRNRYQMSIRRGLEDECHDEAVYHNARTKGQAYDVARDLVGGREIDRVTPGSPDDNKDPLQRDGTQRKTLVMPC